MPPRGDEKLWHESAAAWLDLSKLIWPQLRIYQLVAATAIATVRDVRHFQHSNLFKLFATIWFNLALTTCNMPATTTEQEKSYRTHNLLMTYKSRAVHSLTCSPPHSLRLWLSLSPSLPSTVPVSLLSPPSLKCCQTASETLDEHLPHTWLTCQAAHEFHSVCACVCKCVCDCEHDCELAYTPLHTWVGTVGQKTKVNYDIKLEKSFAKQKVIYQKIDKQQRCNDMKEKLEWTMCSIKRYPSSL